ncbi:MAG: hypothetical protein OEZ13_07710 [Spirochaetia bacterium]|nr:hypothetical protein [Spirochaetia bacterium]
MNSGAGFHWLRQHKSLAATCFFYTAYPKGEKEMGCKIVLANFLLKSYKPRPVVLTSQK